MYFLTYKHKITINHYNRQSDNEMECLTPRGEHSSLTFSCTADGRDIRLQETSPQKPIQEVFQDYINSLTEVKNRHPNAIIAATKFDIGEDENNTVVRSFLPTPRVW